MNNWFECKVSYMKMLESGVQKKVTEPYLVDSLSFTEAEGRITEEMKPYITGDFTVTDIKRARLSEIFFNENGDRFYKCKVYFISLDEKTGTETKTAVQMLSQASDLKEAIAVLEEGMKGTMADYTLGSISETLLMDVFPFIADVDARTAQFNHKDIESLLLDDKKSIEDKMVEAKGMVLSDPQDGDAELISKTQSYIKSKALHDQSLYKEVILELALLTSNPQIKCWFMGCGQLLIEGAEA